MAVQKKDDVLTIDVESLLVPASIVIAGLMISLSVFFGIRSINTNVIGSPVAGAVATVQPTIPSGMENEFAPSTSAIGESAYIGNKETAKIAVIEYSDLNCGYCQRHHLETMPSLLKEYVESGEAVIVYKNFIGVGGDTSAQAASAALCVREQVGNDKYFDLISQVYASDATKDVVLVKDLASKLGGVDTNALSSCIDSGKFDTVVEAETLEGQQAGATGTPGFVVGKIDSNGSVNGVLIAGAYPYSNFESIINGYLAE